MPGKKKANASAEPTYKSKPAQSID